jgi:hypothetical protein
MASSMKPAQKTTLLLLLLYVCVVCERQAK